MSRPPRKDPAAAFPFPCSKRIRFDPVTPWLIDANRFSVSKHFATTIARDRLDLQIECCSHDHTDQAEHAGFRLHDVNLEGAVATATLALLVQVQFEIIERVLTPRG